MYKIAVGTALAICHIIIMIIVNIIIAVLIVVKSATTLSLKCYWL